MLALQETTVWDSEYQPNHIYLMEGNVAHAYIRQGTSEPFYFKKPMTIDFRNRQTKTVSVTLFKQHSSELVEVAGSKGQKYFVSVAQRHCSCPGFKFHGKCKHLDSLAPVIKSKDDAVQGKLFLD